MTTEESRQRTAVDAIADEYVDRVVAMSPLTATSIGAPGEHDGYDDFTPDGWAHASQLRRRTLATLTDAPCEDAVDRVTREAMAERLGLAEEIHEAGLDLADLNNLASPLQSVRDILDLMPTDTPDEVAVLARRLQHIPAALEGWHVSLREAAARGRHAPRRQVLTCIAQARELASDGGYFAGLATLAEAQPSAAGAGLLRTGIEAARRGYGEAAERLAGLLDEAPHHDACGRETYELWSRSFLGARVDLEETYAWGLGEVDRITARLRGVCDRIAPGGSPAEVAALLDGDPRYRIEGTDALAAWMQDRTDEAIEELGGTHFDIPAPVRRIECRIAPTQTGGIYYTGPSDDFSRPGRMWWSVPPGVTSFGTWRELTTVYHEGVPGHHLQVAQTVFRSALLNRWRRLMSWTSGHGEGWALYAERLMEELGFMDDPGNLFGLLDAQSLRAARVVLDLGEHCGFAPPEPYGSGASTWTYDTAWAYLRAHSQMPEPFLRFELDRYLGWPGQAPSYKIGERLWLGLRDEIRRDLGASFDLPAFHRRALDLGGLGLDTFRHAMLSTT